METTTTINEVKDYLDNAIAGFAHDPADSEFQRGYLAAFEVMRDDLFKTRAERAAIAKAQGRTP